MAVVAFGISGDFFMSKRKTTKEFIEGGISVHGDKYDYSKAEYANNKQKICIICPKHGEFWQTPNNHLSGFGCLWCAGHAPLSNDEFINKSNEKHRGLYDYGKTKYERSNIKVIINCPIHGDFKQTPAMHMSGRGCPKCKGSKGERLIKEWLDDEGISYNVQMTFDGLVSKRNNALKFDFYISESNICIEFDGEQHYNKDNGFHKLGRNENSYELLKFNDKRKNGYCEEHNIRLIRIPYWDIHDISNILTNHLR